MNLNLSPEDLEEYTRRCLENEADKQAAIAKGDLKAARKARQENTHLYQEFERRQLPPPPLTEYEQEMRLSLEARVDRIEEKLQLGRYGLWTRSSEHG